MALAARCRSPALDPLPSCPTPRPRRHDQRARASASQPAAAAVLLGALESPRYDRFSGRSARFEPFVVSEPRFFSDCAQISGYAISKKDRPREQGPGLERACPLLLLFSSSPAWLSPHGAARRRSTRCPAVPPPGLAAATGARAPPRLNQPPPRFSWALGAYGAGNAPRAAGLRPSRGAPPFASAAAARPSSSSSCCTPASQAPPTASRAPAAADGCARASVTIAMPEAGGRRAMGPGDRAEQQGEPARPMVLCCVLGGLGGAES